MARSLNQVGGQLVRGSLLAPTNVLPIIQRQLADVAPAVITTAGAATYTVQNIAQGIIQRDPNGASRTDTLPTAALLIAGLQNLYALTYVGDALQFRIDNTADAAENITLAAGTGMTLQGSIVIGAGTSRLVTVIKTGTATVTATVTDPVLQAGAVTAIVSTVATAGAATYTAAQLLGGYIARDPSGANRTDLTSTAALLDAALPTVTTGCRFDVTLKNTADAAETITLNGGTGVTLIGAITIAQNETAILRFVKTGTATYDVVKLG
jgi:hypothetical protein